MAQIKYLLSIAIPTYNRSAFLSRNLDTLLLQKDNLENIVEVIVSDNASTDDTEDVVRGFADRGLKINYIKNKENKGADFNIAQCYTIASGHFLYVIGDDDLLINGSLKPLLQLLEQSKDAGVVYLKDFPINNAQLPEFAGELEFDKYHDIQSFLYRVSYYITFISGNIINRKGLDKVNLNEWLSSHLIQVPLILTAIKNSEYNVVVRSKILAVQIENSGGYNIFQVFGKNLQYIINQFLNERKYRKIIINDLYSAFFPFWIYRLKTKSNYVMPSTKEIISVFNKKNIYFQLFIYPLLLLPKPLAKLFLLPVRVFNFFKKKALFFIYSK